MYNSISIMANHQMPICETNTRINSFYNDPPIVSTTTAHTPKMESNVTFSDTYRQSNPGNVNYFHNHGVWYGDISNLYNSEIYFNYQFM